MLDSKVFLLPITLLALSASSSRADLIAASDFAGDAEGWTATEVIPNQTDQSVGIDWRANDGNPDGHVQVTDPVLSGTTYFVAPAKFLGDASSTYGETLTYDLRSTASVADFDNPEILIQGLDIDGSPLELRYDFDFGTPDNFLPTSNWMTYAVPLDETASRWRINGSGGVVPDQDQMISVLSNVTGLLIRAEFRSGGEEAFLDNVQFGATPVPESSSLGICLVFAVAAWVSQRWTRSMS